MIFIYMDINSFINKLTLVAWHFFVFNLLGLVIKMQNTNKNNSRGPSLKL